MINLDKPLVLIGFKHVGKTALGKALANSLKLPFSDLDSLVEGHYFQTRKESLNCRQIVQKHGMDYFKNSESLVLEKAMQTKACVLALGGGTPLGLANQKILSQGTLIHIKARKGLVFERIMVSGRPAFFPEGEEAYQAFTRIWEERFPVYEKLADLEIENSGSIQEGLEQVLMALKTRAIA